jgi:hypothetical protein
VIDLAFAEARELGSSIVLTADTYTSVLPEVARKAAEDVASLIIAVGCLIPGTIRPRQPEPLPRHRIMLSGLTRRLITLFRKLVPTK